MLKNKVCKQEINKFPTSSLKLNGKCVWMQEKCSLLIVWVGDEGAPSPLSSVLSS